MEIKFYGKMSESCSNEKHYRDFFPYLNWFCFQETWHMPLKTSRWEKKSHMLSIKIGSFVPQRAFKYSMGAWEIGAVLYFFFQKDVLHYPTNSCLWSGLIQISQFAWKRKAISWLKHILFHIFYQTRLHWWTLTYRWLNHNGLFHSCYTTTQPSWSLWALRDPVAESQDGLKDCFEGLVLAIMLSS